MVDEFRNYYAPARIGPSSLSCVPSQVATSSNIIAFLNLSDEFMHRAVTGARREQINISQLMRRRRSVRPATFNLNSLSEHQLLTDFRFKLPEIKLICDALAWNGCTTRNQYICEPMVTCSILLFRLATTQRWYDTELKFGIYSSQMSENFWGAGRVARTKVWPEARSAR